MGIFVPQAATRRPDLLIPGRLPQGPLAVNWDNPLTEGLVACVVFNANNLARPVNLVDGKTLDRGSTDSNVTMPEFDPQGALFNESTITPEQSSYILRDLTVEPPFSFTTLPIWQDYTGSLFQYFLSWGTVQTERSFNMFLNEQNASGPGRLQVVTTPFSTVQYRVTTDFYAGEYADQGPGPMTYRSPVDSGDQAGDQALFFNGSELNASCDSPTTTWDFPTPTTRDLVIGRREDGNNGRAFGGVLSFVFVHVGRHLTDSDIRVLHDNPYQIVRAR